MTFKAFINAYVVTIIGNFLVPILIAAMLIVFLYGLLTYMISADDPKKHADAMKYIVRGAIGLAIAMSIWAIVALGATFFGSAPVIPQLR